MRSSSSPELLLELDVSVLEVEYRRIVEEGANASAAGKPVAQLGLAIAREFVEFVSEFASEEFGFRIPLEDHAVSADGIIGLADFPMGRQAAISKVEKRGRQACGNLPGPCRAGRPLLDGLLSRIEVIRAPGHTVMRSAR